MTIGMFCGCGNKKIEKEPLITPEVSNEQKTYDEYAKKTVEYINEDDARKLVDENITGYQAELDVKMKNLKDLQTIIANEPSDSTAAGSANEIVPITAIKYEIKLEDNNLYKGNEACGMNSDNIYECLNDPEDSYYLFRIYDIYVYGETESEFLSEKYKTKNFIVNKITKELEIIDTAEINTVGTEYDGKYTKDTGDASISIEGSDLGYIFSYEENVNGAINGLTGLAEKDALPNVFIFDCNGEPVEFRFADGKIVISTNSTSAQAASLSGTYKK